MAEQPNLFPSNSRSPGSASGPRLADAEVSTRPFSWAARVEMAVRFLVRLYLGLLILVLPWLGFWTQNNLFTYSRTLLVISQNGFVRGMVSGLGLLTVVLAVVEIESARRQSRTVHSRSRTAR